MLAVVVVAVVVVVVVVVAVRVPVERGAREVVARRDVAVVAHDELDVFWAAEGGLTEEDDEVFSDLDYDGGA